MNFPESSFILVSSCPEENTDYFLNGITSPFKMSDQPITRSWEECGKMCKDEPMCAYWTWLGSNAGEVNRFRCLLKTSNNGARAHGSAISGDSNCTSLGKFLFNIRS